MKSNSLVSSTLLNLLQHSKDIHTMCTHVLEMSDAGVYISQLVTQVSLYIPRFIIGHNIQLIFIDFHIQKSLCKCNKSI